MPLTVKENIEAFLSASKDKAFIRREFNCFGSYRQVSRAIGNLIREGKLIRCGMGIVVKAKQGMSPFKSNYGEIITYPVTDAVCVALQVLPKLGYKVRMGSLDEARLTGKTTQITILAMVRVDGARPRRLIVVNGQRVIYEQSPHLG